MNEFKHHFGLNQTIHLQEWERLRVARSKSPGETVLGGWYPGWTHSPERQRRLASQAVIKVICSPPGARRRRGIVRHGAIPRLAKRRAAVMEHRIASSPDRSLRLRRLVELRRPWAHWQLRRLPVSIWRLQCGCLLLLFKCFSVEC
jgi:hypothetical protein